MVTGVDPDAAGLPLRCRLWSRLPAELLLPAAVAAVVTLLAPVAAVIIGATNDSEVVHVGHM